MATYFSVYHPATLTDGTQYTKCYSYPGMSYEAGKEKHRIFEEKIASIRNRARVVNNLVGHHVEQGGAIPWEQIKVLFDQMDEFINEYTEPKVPEEIRYLYNDRLDAYYGKPARNFGPDPDSMRFPSHVEITYIGGCIG